VRSRHLRRDCGDRDRACAGHLCARAHRRRTADAAAGRLDAGVGRLLPLLREPPPDAGGATGLHPGAEGRAALADPRVQAPAEPAFAPAASARSSSDATAPPATQRVTTSARWSISTGLERKLSMPAARQRSWSLEAASAVMAMIGTALRGAGRARIRRVRSEEHTSELQSR